MMFFFIGVFGVQDRHRTIREFENVICPCGSFSRGELIEHYTYFHFFFIPLFKWNKRYYIRYRCCNSLYKIPDDYIGELRHASDIDVDRLEELTFHRRDICPECGVGVDPSFTYCPYCGKSI